MGFQINFGRTKNIFPPIHVGSWETPPGCGKQGMWLEEGKSRFCIQWGKNKPLKEQWTSLRSHLTTPEQGYALV